MGKQHRNKVRQSLINLRQPAPFQVKLWQTIRNYYLRLRRLDTCCGNHGQPGC